MNIERCLVPYECEDNSSIGEFIKATKRIIPDSNIYIGVQIPTNLKFKIIDIKNIRSKIFVWYNHFFMAKAISNKKEIKWQICYIFGTTRQYKISQNIEILSNKLIIKEAKIILEEMQLILETEKNLNNITMLELNL